MKILQFCSKLQNTVLLVELVSSALGNIYSTISMLCNLSNEFQHFKEFAGHAKVNSVDYSGKQKLRGE